MFVGGDIREINYKHPTVGSGTISPKANEDFKLDTGGITSVDDESMITSSGEMIDQKNTKRWSMEGVVATDMNVRDEAEKMKQLQASSELAEWTFEHINGSIYGGKGIPVGNIVVSTNASTMSLKIAGERKLEKRS